MSTSSQILKYDIVEGDWTDAGTLKAFRGQHDDAHLQQSHPRIPCMRNMLSQAGWFHRRNFVRWISRRPRTRMVVLDISPTPLMRAGSRDARCRAGRGIFVRTLGVYLLHSRQLGTILHFAAESHVDRSISGPAAFIQTNLVVPFPSRSARKYGQEMVPPVPAREHG